MPSANPAFRDGQQAGFLVPRMYVAGGTSSPQLVFKMHILECEIRFYALAPACLKVKVDVGADFVLLRGLLGFRVTLKPSFVLFVVAPR